MKKQNYLLRISLRLCTISVIVLTFFCVIIILSNISIRNKYSIEVVYEHNGKVYGYVNKTVPIAKSSSINVYTSDNHLLEFYVQKRYSQEKTVMELVPVDSLKTMDYLISSPVLSAYIFQGETKLIDKVFKKWSIK